MFKVTILGFTWSRMESIRVPIKHITFHENMDGVCRRLYDNYVSFVRMNEETFDIKKPIRQGFLIVYDESDIPMRPETIEFHFWNWFMIWTKSWKNRWHSRPFKFRDGPVPWTGNRRRRKYRCGSKPIKGVKQKLMDKHIRPKSKMGLDPWEEYGYRHVERNWKSQRKTQWKG